MRLSQHFTLDSRGPLLLDLVERNRHHLRRLDHGDDRAPTPLATVAQSATAAPVAGQHRTPNGRPRHERAPLAAIVVWRVSRSLTRRPPSRDMQLQYTPLSSPRPHSLDLGEQASGAESWMKSWMTAQRPAFKLTHNDPFPLVTGVGRVGIEPTT